MQNSKKLDASVHITPEWSLLSLQLRSDLESSYNFRCWSGISVEARESISSKEDGHDIAISKASKSRATSIASKASAEAQPAETAASTAAKTQAAKASVAVAQAAVVVAVMAHGDRVVSLVCCSKQELACGCQRI